MRSICANRCPIGPKCEARVKLILSNEDADIGLLQSTMDGMQAFRTAQETCPGRKVSWAGWIIRGLSATSPIDYTEQTPRITNEYSLTDIFPSCSNRDAHAALKMIPAIIPVPENLQGTV